MPAKRPERNSSPADPDTVQVMEVLGGVRRGRSDPDVELARILPELEGISDADDADDVVLALKRLVLDANTD